MADLMCSASDGDRYDNSSESCSPFKIENRIRIVASTHVAGANIGTITSILLFLGYFFTLGRYFC